MTMSDTWAELNSGALTGASFAPGGSDQGSGGLYTGMDTAVSTRGGPNAPLYSPENPLFWFGVLLAGVAGFIGVSGWVDLGPIKLKGKA